MTIHWHFEKSSRPALGDGGHVNTQAGSRGTVTQYNSGAENVIQFLPRAKAPSNSRPSQAAFSIDDDDRETGVACVLAVLGGFAAVFVGAALYLGSLIFNFFDFG